jgi:hypothetical protein
MCGSGGRLLLVAVLGFGATASIHGGGLAVVESRILDNGDGDAFADTNESVRLELVLRNTSGHVLTRATLHASSASPTLACSGSHTVLLDRMEVDEQRTVEIVFRVANVDRSDSGLDALGSLSATIDLRAVSDQVVGPTVPGSVVLDLDLDVSGGAGPRTFAESFEFGIGGFRLENLDAERHGPAADGYRCQYHDPDLPSSNNYGWAADCPMGANPTQGSKAFCP